MLLPVVKALLGHYRRYPLQFILVWLGLTLGVSLLIGVTTITYHAQVGYQEVDQLTANPFPYQIKAKKGEAIPNSLFETVSNADVGQCTPYAQAKVTTDFGVDLTIIGIDRTIANRAFSSPIPDKYQVVVSRKFAQQALLDSGDSLVLKNGKTLGPVWVEDNNLVYGLRAASSIQLVQSLNEKQSLSMVACADMPPFKLTKLKSILGDKYKVKRNYRSELSALTQAFNMNLKAMGLLAFLVGLFIFSQAISLSFIQRQRLVGMLRQAGVARRDLTKAIVIELLFFIIISWLCGNIFGLVLANQLLPSVYGSAGIVENPNMFYGIDLWWCFYSLILTIVGAACACIWPVIRLLKSEPIRLTERLSLIRFAGSEFTVQTYFSIVFAILAIVLFYYIHIPEVGLGVLVLVLVSVAFITPFIVWKFFDFLSYSLSSVRLRWFFADSAASMSYRGIATMAFLIALATNIAAETLVGSFRETTSQWLEHRLAADLYFHGTAEQSQYIDEWLRDQPEVSDFWQRWETDVTTDNGTVQVVSVGRSDVELQALTIKVGAPDYWYKLHHSKTVLLNESTASKLDLRPGDHLNLPSEMGDDWLVGGIYYDYGNPHFQVVISDFEWRHHFQTNGDLIYAVDLHHSSYSDSVRSKLDNMFHLTPDRIYGNSQIYNAVIRVFDKTFLVAKKLGNITLFIAICGVFVATLAGEAARQRHFTLLRCFGVSGKELILIGSLQLLTFGLICLAIAVPLGIGLAQLIISTSIKGSFGWSIPLDYFSADLFSMAAWSLGALVIAGAFPIIRLVRRSPMNILRNSM
ncbi:ABC transporter permease [Vibrio sp. WJH972]